MQNTVGFHVKGANPNKAFFDLAIANRIARSRIGLADCIVGSESVGNGGHLVLVARDRLLALQERQKVSGLLPESAQIGGENFQRKQLLLATKTISPQMPAIEVQEHNDSLADVKRILLASDVKVTEISADKITPQDLVQSNLVAVFGGDGTFLKVASMLQNGIPIFGINSAPSRSFGHYLKVTAETLEAALNALLTGQYCVLDLPRICAVISDSQGREAPVPSALNDLFVKDMGFAKATRTRMGCAKRHEDHFSDGVLISAATATGVNSWMHNSGGVIVGEGSGLIQCLSFNPNRTDRQGNPNLLTHFVTGEPFTVESLGRHDTRYGINGEEVGPFPSGSSLMICPGGSSVRMIEFRAKTENVPAQDILPELNPRKDHGLTAEEITKIDTTHVCRSVRPGEKKQILLLHLSDDLSSLRILTIMKRGGVVLSAKNIVLNAEIKDPRLLYPTAEIGNLPSVDRDIVHNLFRYGNYITLINGVVVDWDPSEDKNVWGPSIDTVFFIHSLQKHGVFNGSVRVVAEIGTGGGMIIKAALEKCLALEEIRLTDVEMNALRCSLRNLQPVLREEVRTAAYNAKGIKDIGTVDLLLINPPYIPKPAGNGINQYEGTGLIREVVSDGLEHLNPENPEASIVINYSSLAQNDFDQFVQGREDLEIELLETLTVPLKINWTSIDSEWLNYLITECGLEIRDDQIHGYRYWHTLKIIKIKRKHKS